MVRGDVEEEENDWTGCVFLVLKEVVVVAVAVAELVNHCYHLLD